MVTSIYKQNRSTIFYLFMIILVATLLRLNGLSTRTITHIEMYVPGIELNPELSLPGPRYTIKQVFTSMMEEMEPHPPGYYIFMLILTKLLNTDIFTIRLPSLIFGVGSVLLLFILGYLEKAEKAALWASGMLALNGFHILWSQLAKMYMMGCFLGLLSSVLLILVVRNWEDIWGWLFGLLYLIATFSGLATTIWFWPILVAHILWVLKLTWRNKSAPGLLRLQFLVIILASPLISLAIFQSQRPSYAAEEGGLLQQLGQFLQLGFLFVREYLPAPSRWFQPLATILLAPLSILLLGFGLVYDSKVEKRSFSILMKGPSSLYILVAVACVIVVILRLAKFTYGYNAVYTRFVVASIAIPIIIFFTTILIEKQWLNIQSLISALDKKVSSFRVEISLSAFLAVVPVAIIIVISPIIFLFASRGVLIYIPYLLLMLSKGLMELASRTKYWLVAAAILVVIHPLSILYFQNVHIEDGTDYKTLAEQWIPDIKGSDLIFIPKTWMATPIFYYLKPNEYHFFANNFAEKVVRYPTSRIWVLSGEEFSTPQEAIASLDGYKKITVIRARRIEADLYLWQDQTKIHGLYYQNLR